MDSYVESYKVIPKRNLLRGLSVNPKNPKPEVGGADRVRGHLRLAVVFSSEGSESVTVRGFFAPGNPESPIDPLNKEIYALNYRGLNLMI